MSQPQQMSQQMYDTLLRSRKRLKCYITFVAEMSAILNLCLIDVIFFRYKIYLLKHNINIINFCACILFCMPIMQQIILYLFQKQYVM